MHFMHKSSNVRYVENKKQSSCSQETIVHSLILHNNTRVFTTSMAWEVWRIQVVFFNKIIVERRGSTEEGKTSTKAPARGMRMGYLRDRGR